MYGPLWIFIVILHLLWPRDLLSSNVELVSQQRPARLVGQVFDQETRQPIVGASIRVLNKHTPTDASGRFEIDGLPGGVLAVVSEMLGYRTRHDTVALNAGATHELEIALSRAPIELAPVAVTVRSEWLEQNGFYERLRSGLSPRAVTASDIERRGSTVLTDVFSQLAGVRVMRIPGGGRVVRMMHEAPDGFPVLARRALPGCEPALFIDGAPYRDQIPTSPSVPGSAVRVLDWDAVSPLVVEAVEVYRGSAAPVQYQDTCGVVLVWIRRR